MTRRVRSIHGDAGFSLVEMLVSTAVLLLVTGTVFSLISPSTTTYKAQPEAADMQQRMRVGTNALQQDLVMAGAGTYSGLAVGTLLSYFAPIVPYKFGTFINDIDDGITYRPDAITIMYVPQTAAQTTIRDPMPQPSAEVKVNSEPGCPIKTPPDKTDPLCGFDQGMRVVIFDETGAYDPFTVTQVQEDALHLQHRDDDFSKSYQLGAVITEVVSHVYYLRQDVAAGRFQLMHYNGYDRDEPLVDDVVGLQFTYYGDPQPPFVIDMNKRPHTTYGPKPPKLGFDNEGDPWAAGENCLFTIDPGSGQPVSRIPALAPGTGLVEITQAMLQDGPWCPGPAAANRFDADMLRVRRVGVRLRVQVASADLRGPAGLLFTRGGTSLDSKRLVPDQEIRFEVTPRNMNLGR